MFPQGALHRLCLPAVVAAMAECWSSTLAAPLSLQRRSWSGEVSAAGMARSVSGRWPWSRQPGRLGGRSECCAGAMVAAALLHRRRQLPLGGPGIRTHLCGRRCQQHRSLRLAGGHGAGRGALPGPAPAHGEGRVGTCGSAGSWGCTCNGDSVGMRTLRSQGSSRKERGVTDQLPLAFLPACGAVVQCAAATAAAGAAPGRGCRDSPGRAAVWRSPALPGRMCRRQAAHL